MTVNPSRQRGGSPQAQRDDTLARAVSPEVNQRGESGARVVRRGEGRHRALSPTTREVRMPPHGFSRMSGSASLPSRNASLLEWEKHVDGQIKLGAISDEHGDIHVGGRIIGRFEKQPISYSKIPADIFKKVPNHAMPCIEIIRSDIMTEIANPKNSGAYFVLPSQLNGAEYPDHHTIKKHVSDYLSDDTGGPQGQLAVDPAAATFILDNARNDLNTSPNSINAIDAILNAWESENLGFELQNGYLKIPPELNGTQQTLALDLLEDHLNTLRSLVMMDVQASGLTRDTEGLKWERDKSMHKHRVTLVYASAIPIDAYNNKLAEQQSSQLREEHFNFQVQVGYRILFGQYYGALQHAARRNITSNRKVKIYLMLLGGSSFNNPLNTIASAISAAVESLTPPQRQKLDIRMLCFGDTEAFKFARELLGYEKLNSKMETYGTWNKKSRTWIEIGASFGPTIAVSPEQILHFSKLNIRHMVPITRKVIWHLTHHPGRFVFNILPAVSYTGNGEHLKIYSLGVVDNFQHGIVYFMIQISDRSTRYLAYTSFHSNTTRSSSKLPNQAQLVQAADSLRKSVRLINRNLPHDLNLQRALETAVTNSNFGVG